MTHPDPVLALEVKYTPEYPDAVPEMCVRVLEDAGEILGPAPAEQDEEQADVFVTDSREGAQQLRQELDQVVCVHVRFGW